MGDGKGKDRAPDKRDEKGSNDAAPDSMFSRVVASATGLAKSTFTSPTNNEVKDAAVTASTTSGKGHIPAGSGNSAWAESSKQAQHNALSSNQARGAPSSFRLGHSEEHVRNAELEFSSFFDGIDTFKPSETGHNALVTGQALEPILGRADSQLPVSAVSPPITVAEQERLDGAEVVAILSGPNTASDMFDAPGEDEESFNWGLTEKQLRQIRTVTKDLFLPFEPHGTISADNPLNLNPSFVDQHDILRIDSSANESYMYFGVGEPGEVKQIWREQWEGVLTRYADEVWGDLLPLVKEARKEVEELGNAEGSGSHEPKALRRLGMILGHLRKQ